MRIECDSMEQFLDVVAGLHERGIEFHANANRLIITLN